MDNDFLDYVTDQMPQMNRTLIDGLSYAESDRIEDYINRVWLTAAEDFPEGLVYKGYRRLSPEEEYLFSVRRGSTAAKLELARTDQYLVAYFFSFRGEDLPPCHLYLPYISVGGILHVDGSKYVVSPVLADNGPSVEEDYVFVPILRDRMRFHRTLIHVRIDGHETPVYVIWSHLHRENTRKVSKSTAHANSSLPHYLFARFGVTRTFLQYAGVHVVIGEEATMNRETYPPDRWTLVSSIKQSPWRNRRGSAEFTSLVLAIPKEECSELALNLAAGFFYVADYFPDRVSLEDADDPYLWIVLLGLTIWGSGESEGQLAQKTEAHLDSLATHLDKESNRELQAAGINVNDMYDLFVYLIQNVVRMLVEAAPNLSTMWGKRLIVLRYFLRDFVTSINYFMYSVKEPLNREGIKKPLTAKDISTKLNEQIYPNVISKIKRGHGEVDTSISSPGDNQYFKITGRIVKQVNSSGIKARSININDPANLLHASIAEVGSFLTPSSSSPTGHERVNPCVGLTEDRLIKRNEKNQAALDDVQKRIRRS